MSREVVGMSKIEMVDLQGVEDENERAKAMKQCIEDDQKKTLRVNEVEERADHKEGEGHEVTGKVHQEGQKEYEPPSRTKR